MEIHKHHKIPRHAGGTDDPENIQELSRYEHAVEHLILFYHYHRREDLCAYYMLKHEMEKFRSEYGHLGGKSTQVKRKAGGLTSFGLKPNSEKHVEIARKGGKVTGPANAKSGHMTRIQQMADCSAAGKRGSAKCKELGVNAFFDPVEHRKAAVKGGSVQGKYNVASGHLKKISQLSKRNTGMFWITDGTANSMLPSGSLIPDGWRKGRASKCRV